MYQVLPEAVLEVCSEFEGQLTFKAMRLLKRTFLWIEENLERCNEIFRQKHYRKLLHEHNMFLHRLTK